MRWNSSNNNDNENVPPLVMPTDNELSWLWAALMMMMLSRTISLLFQIGAIECKVWFWWCYDELWIYYLLCIMIVIIIIIIMMQCVAFSQQFTQYLTPMAQVKLKYANCNTVFILTAVRTEYLFHVHLRFTRFICILGICELLLLIIVAYCRMKCTILCIHDLTEGK